MSAALQDVLSILDLEPLEVNLFRGRSPQSRWQRVFGGQVIGQALVAACRTVEDIGTRRPHSLHAYFLLGGDPKVPIIYEVDRIRDGKSFTTRRVNAIQHGRAIFSMAVSFHVTEEGWMHQLKMPDVPTPDELPSEPEIRSRFKARASDPISRYYKRGPPIELRPVEYGRYFGEKLEGDRFPLWIRAAGRLPDEPAIHQCVLAYASDLTLLDTALVPLGKTVFNEDVMAASLDHALWFHRPFRADEWLLYAQDSPNLGGSRGLARGSIYPIYGTLVGSGAQEGLLRERRAAVTLFAPRSNFTQPGLPIWCVVQKCAGCNHEARHRHHQTVQGRAGARCASCHRRPRHDRDRGQGLRAPEGSHRDLSRR